HTSSDRDWSSDVCSSDLGGVDRDPIYNALKLDRQTREVVEFARQDPVGYLWTLVPLGLYSIGVSGAVDGFPPLAPDVLAVSILRSEERRVGKECRSQWAE